MNINLQAYYAQLTAEIDSLYTEEAFTENQVLPLIAEKDISSAPQAITYYLPELDKLETIPARLLRFEGFETIDEEHYFFFFTIDFEKVYHKLKASQRVLCATLALVPMQGYKRLLVQHVEAIPESRFRKEHTPATLAMRNMAC